MDIKYLGPSRKVNVHPFGAHLKDAVKTYPNEFGRELLESSSKQLFEEVEGSGKGSADAPTGEERKAKILAAAKMCVDEEKVIGSGKPDVKAMIELLEFDITAAERDEAWDELQKDSGDE